MKKILSTGLMTLLTCFLTQAIASPAPDVADAKKVVEESINTTFSDLEANYDRYKANPKLLNGAIEQKILPYFDLSIMSRYVLGRNWKGATEKQRQDFQVAFKDLMMRTYSSSLLGYVGTKAEFSDPTPIRKNRTKVTATLITTDHKKVPLEISLYYNGETWKGYDVSLDGLSLITSFRSSVGDEVSAKGMDAVIKEMQSKNTKGETYDKK